MQNMFHPNPPSPNFFFIKNSSNVQTDLNLETREIWVDRQFVEMLNGYRSSGGLARLQELVCSNWSGKEVDIAMVASCISRRELICFEWQSHAWLPLFQFNGRDMAPHPQLLPVVQELSCIFDPWELAHWFSQPNPWLSDRAPADMLLTDLPAVLQAARADRFVAS
jgi:hypothetical protein